MADSLFRNTARGREPLATAGEAARHIHYQSMRRVGIGSITSKPRGYRPLTFFEALAIQSGLTLTEVLKLNQEGKLR